MAKLMIESLSFNYISTKKSLVNYIFWLSLIAVPSSCLLTVIASIVLSFVSQKLFSAYLLSYLPFIFFLVVIIGFLFNGLNNRLVTLTFSDEKLSWRVIRRANQTIYRNEIKQIKFNKKGYLLVNNHLKIAHKRLPLKKSIELGSFLPHWLPENALPPEYQDYLIWKKQFLEEHKEEISFLKTVQTNKRKSRWLRWIGFASITIFTGLLIWSISTSILHESFVPVIILGIPIFLFSIIIWKSTEFRSIRVNEHGITYQKGKKVNYFDWNEIETLGVRVRTQDLLIWMGERYKSYTYKQMNSQLLDETVKTIFQQAIIRDIPIAMV